MVRHVRHAHKAWAEKEWGSVEKLACLVCGRQFSRKDNMLKHMKLHDLVLPSK